MQIYLSGIYIYFACLGVLVFFCLFVSNKRQNGRTVRAQFVVGFTYKIRELFRLFNVFIKKMDGVISVLSVSYHALVISVLSVNY